MTCRENAMPREPQLVLSTEVGPGVTEKVGPTQALAPVSVTAETGPT